MVYFCHTPVSAGPIVSTYPSPKVFATAFFLVVFVTGLFFVAQKGSTRETYKSPRLVASGEGVSANSDWQKTLATIGTTSTPNFETTNTTGTPVGTITESDEKLTSTETLGRKLLVAYTQLQQQGNVTAADQQKLLSQIVDETIASTTPAIAPYGASDIKITTTAESDAVVAAYRTAIASAINAHGYSTLGTELTNFESAVTNKDESALLPIKKASTAYGAIVKALLAIPAPTSLAQTHLGIINGFAILGASTAEMLQVFTDPVVSLAAVSHYAAGMQLMDTNLRPQIFP